MNDVSTEITGWTYLPLLDVTFRIVLLKARDEEDHELEVFSSSIKFRVF